MKDHFMVFKSGTGSQLHSVFYPKENAKKSNQTLEKNLFLGEKKPGLVLRK